MSIREKIFVSFAAIIGLLFPLHAFASIIFSEVMYNPTGDETKNEWVEIYNNGGSSVSISGWTFMDSPTSSHHGLNTPAQGSFTIATGAYAIIANDATTFLSSHSGVSATVIDSSFSMKDTSANTISLLDASGASQATMNYDPADGAANDGNSLQLVGSSWLAGAPTPAAQNSASSQSEETASTVEDDKNEITDFVPSGFTAEILAPTVVAVGVPAEFDSFVENEKKEKINTGRYEWSFGDGSSLSYIDEKPFTHMFEYPGEYIVTMTFFENSSGDKSDDSDQLSITVTDNRFVLGNVGADGSVSIKNISSYQTDLAGWSVSSGGFRYTFPKFTIVRAGSALTVGPRILGFSADASDTTLFTPAGILADRIPRSGRKISHSASSASSFSNSSADSEKNFVAANTESIPSASILLLASGAVSQKPISEKPTNHAVWYITFVILLSLAGTAIYFIRRAPMRNLSESEKIANTFSIEEDLEGE